MHVPVRFLCQNSDLCVLCRHSGYVCYCIVFSLQSLLSEGCTDVALTFWQMFEQFCWLKRAGRYAARCWYTPIVCRTSCFCRLFMTLVSSSKLAMRWRISSHLETVPSAKLGRFKLKSWRASTFIIWRWRIERDVSRKIHLGHVCAAGKFDDIFLHPWWFVMILPCQVCC